MKKKTVLSLALGAAVPWLGGPALAQAPSTSVDEQAPERIKSLGVVTVTGGQPTSLPTQIPTTIEGVTREEIETRINATDSEDALKYLPSLLVRKRYIGDYNHVNAFAYFGASSYFTVDLRIVYRIDRRWSAAFGIENANDEQYCNFHPYPQRTYSAELRFDL